MLSGEEAGTELERQKSDALSKRRKPGGKAGDVIGMIENPRRLSAVHDYSEELGLALDQMGRRKRQEVFSYYLPKLSQLMEAMWQRTADSPYQSGWDRRAFRAPSNSSASLPARALLIRTLISSLKDYDPDIEWVARWAAYVDSYGGMARPFGHLLATAIDDGNERVYGLMISSAETDGDDPIAAMGRHVIVALLCSDRQEGWTYVEQMLLAAQRQEGLRQTILESADEARPEAFRRMLALILEHDLTRFSAAARAISVWLGVAEHAGDRKRLNQLVTLSLEYLESEKAARDAIRSGTGEEAYQALWALAYGDVFVAMTEAEPLLQDSDAERRLAAVHLLAQLGLWRSLELLLPVLGDSDLRVALWAAKPFLYTAAGGPLDLYQPVERLVLRLDRRTVEVEPLLWPWTAQKFDRSRLAGVLLRFRGKRTGVDLLPHKAAFDTYARTELAGLLGEEKTPEARAALLEMVGDASPGVRGIAIERLPRQGFTDAEALEVEKLLSRKAGDLRRGVMGLILSRSDSWVLEAADRLLADKSQLKRAAGAELLRSLVEQKRSAKAALARLDSGAKARPAESESAVESKGSKSPAQPKRAPDKAEAELAQARAGIEEASASLDDGLGLFDPGDLTDPLEPQDRGATLWSPAASAVLQELDRLVDEHRETEIETVDYFGGKQVEPLGAIRFFRPMIEEFVRPSRHQSGTGNPDERAADVPLWSVFSEWAKGRQAPMRDGDGHEFWRSYVTPLLYRDWQGRIGTTVGAGAAKAILGRAPAAALKYGEISQGVSGWLALAQSSQATLPFLLDASETLLSNLPSRLVEVTSRDGDWRGRGAYRDRSAGWLLYFDLAWILVMARPDLAETADLKRLWRLTRWVERPTRPRISNLGPLNRLAGSTSGRLARTDTERVVAAFRAGVANEADLFDHLIGPRPPARNQHFVGSSGVAFTGLRNLSGAAALAENPAARAVVDRTRERIVELELRRGEAPTVASQAALALFYSGGANVLFEALAALGKRTFVRGWSYDTEGRDVVFSWLVRASFPGEGDTPGAFAKEAAKRKVSDKRLIELAAYAPQWAKHVEGTLDWPGLASAVWWLHAHTKDDKWIVPQETRDVWAAEVSERTPLAANELVEGAVDVAWFGDTVESLGRERFLKLLAAAKYCASGAGHRRAELFATAMLGEADEADLKTRVEDKRQQDAVRAYGLLPLAKGKGRDRDLLDRYRLIQEFLRTSRQFGSQRQASERRAAEVGLENLARTAGFPDPLRLSWALEAEALAELLAAPAIEAEGSEIKLSVVDGEPQLLVTKGERELKSVPAKARKLESVKELRAQVTDLRRQRSRIKGSLEEAMVRGDSFTGAELREFSKHALLRPRLQALVLLGDGTAGYPGDDFQTLRDHQGNVHSIGVQEEVRIAHPVDLLKLGDWPEWQRDLLARQVVQPFKQLFRELYVPVADEADSDITRRYAGHQIQPRKALALLGGRGWVNHPEQGIKRTYHRERLQVGLSFLDGYLSPVEVEAPTLEGIYFAKVEDGSPVPISALPPRLFSEVMRDLDLVVSVAHVGGVDPEASLSTTEMRAQLLEETVSLLDLDNVRVDGARALISGKIGEYSVHLGSAVVHRMPGGSVCIVPIHSQHRGRLFLPFADDDPKTAEVMSKVLLLARDNEIKDPTILEQLRA